MNRNDPLGDSEPVRVRDLHRIQEKITLRVEPRHAWLAGIGGLILIVLAFLVGLVLGRSCEPGNDTPPLSRPEGTGQSVVSKQATKGFSPPSTPARTPSVLPRNAVRPVLAIRGPAWPGSGERRGPDEVLLPKSPETAQDIAPWPAIAVSDPCAGVSCGAPEGCYPRFSLPSLGVIVASSARIHRRIHEAVYWGWRCGDQVVQSIAGTLARTLALANRPPRVSPGVTPSPTRQVTQANTAHPPARPTPLASGGFTVQVRSYRDERMAREYAFSLKSQGYSVHVSRHEDEAGQAWFRVRVGHFERLGEARDFARRLNERTGDQAIVTAMEAR